MLVKLISVRKNWVALSSSVWIRYATSFSVIPPIYKIYLSIVCVELAHCSSRWLKGYNYSSYYYHNQIGSIHLSHRYHIFSVVVCLRCLLHHILSLIAYTSLENREFVFIIIVQFMNSANTRMRFGLQSVLVCLYSTPSHYHHCANLSKGIELIKCQSDKFVECVSKIKRILSAIHYTICGVVCF